MDATTGETTQAVGAIRDLWRNGRVLGAAIAHGSQPTLRHRVDRIVRAHVKQNAAFKDLRYSGVRAALASLRQHPRVALFIIGLIYGAAILTAAVVPAPDWAPNVRSGVSDAYRDMLTVTVALLGAQATLLGLVYPLVIALVGVLFEARSTPGGRLQIFFLETEALAAGGMALGFILVVAIEAMSWGVLPQNILVAVTALNVAWFAANLGALAFFVLRSLQFLQPSRRQDLAKSYVANTTWRSELVRALLVNRWIGAGVYGDLPPRKDPDDRSWVTVFALDAARVNRRLPQRAQLVDIHLGRLAAVLANLGAETDLRFRCFPGDVYAGDTILASADHATLTAADRWLIRSAFRFGVPQRHFPPTTSELLKEGVADLLGLRAAGRYEEFAKLLSHTIELHALLYGLAQSADLDDGEPVNWGDLVRPRLMGGSLCQAWCQAYIELIQSVADQLGPDGRYFDACATLATRLMWRGDGVRASALDPILELPGVAAGALIDGAARRHVEALGTPPTRGQLFITARAGAAYYRRAWINFVGGWESLGEAILAEMKGDDWEVFCRRRSLVQRHLRDTTILAARAAKAGDRDAIGWTTDMVLKWYGQFSMRRGANPGWALRRSVLTLPLLSRPFAEVQALDIALFNQPAEPRQVIDAIFENAWRDSLLVLCSSMIGLMGDGVGPVLIEDGPSRCAAAVFCNESFDPQASNHPQSAPLDAQSVLFSTLRLVGSGERFEPSYNGAMSGLADAIDRLDGPNFVNARIYSWVGMAEVQGQALAQAVLLMAAVELRPGRNPAGVALDDSLSSLLVPEADHDRRRLSEHLSQMVIAFDRLDPPRGQALVGTLRQSTCSPTEYDERVVGARAIIEACRDKIAEVRLAAITSATIDPERLRAVARSASGGISKEATTFPFHLFNKVETTTDPLRPWTYRYGAPRGEYTIPPMGQPLSDEEGWWARTIEGYAGVLLFWDMTEKGPFTRRAPGTAPGWWRACKQAVADVQAAGQTPIIVRATGVEPRWLFDWQWNQAGTRPADMTFTQGPSPGASYDFHINGVPVFSCSAAGRATWVLGRELFESARFHRFPSGLTVEVGFEPDTDPWKGTLLVKLQHSAVRGAGPIWRIGHPAPTPPATRRRRKSGPSAGGQQNGRQG